MEQANAACRYVSDPAWETKTFRQYDLHHTCYQAIREQFGLSAQGAIAKVADVYNLDRKTKRTFKTAGSIAFDDRILSWRLQDQIDTIWTGNGRLRIPFVCGERQLEMLQTRQGESDLGLYEGLFFLSAPCEVNEPKPIDVEGALGWIWALRISRWIAMEATRKQPWLAIDLTWQNASPLGRAFR